MSRNDIKNKFLQHYPTAEAVLERFTPDNWAKALSNAYRLAELPCLTLAQLDQVYNLEGLALAVVKAQFDGLRGNAETSGEARRGAELFCAKYGHECSLFALMVYFADFFSFKTTWKTFDTNDILKQFGEKFLPKWREKANTQEAETTNETEPAIPIEQWLKNRLTEGRTPKEIRAGGLYWTGVVTETMIAETLAEINAEAFSY